MNEGVLLKPNSPASRYRSSRSAAVLATGAVITVASVALYADVLIHPALLFDDFVIIDHSWTARRALENFWLPHNEHAMPWGRLSTLALIHLDGRLSTLPLRAAVQGVLALIVAVWLVYLLVRRELDSPFFGLLAMALFGVSLKYQETVTWFAASFWLLGLVTLLLALLAAQSWKSNGRRRWLLVAVLLSGLAPGWYAGGILAGPCCVLYLWPREGPGWRVRLRALAPLLGTAAFLALSLPHNSQRILHAEHYEGQSAIDVADPWIGFVYTVRAVVDILVFNPRGTGGDAGPLAAVVPIAVGLLAAVAWLWLPKGKPRGFLWLGLGLIVLHYGLVFSVRSQWEYRQIRLWTRYNLAPFLGMVLILCGGLARNFHPVREDLSARQLAVLLLLTAALFVTQFRHRATAFRFADEKMQEQQAALEQVDAMDQRCRSHRIAAETARRVLQPLEISYSDKFNGWNWLRGSDDPLPWTDDDVRRMIGEK
jgi:hypothetical protein